PLSSLLSMIVGVIKMRAPFTPEYFHHAAVLLPATKCPEVNPTMSGVCPTTLPESVTSAAFSAPSPQFPTSTTTATRIQTFATALILNKQRTTVPVGSFGGSRGAIHPPRQL